MKHLILAAAAVPVCLAAAPASAQDMFAGLSPYVRAAVGASFSQDDSAFKLDGGGGFGEVKDGYVLSGAAGVAFDFGLRLEGELGWRGERTTSGSGSLGGVRYGAASKIELLTLMANAFYDLDFGSPIVPYVGGGIGWAQAKAKTLTVELDGLGRLSSEQGATESGFAWSLMAGVAYRLSTSTSVDLGYRYLDAGTAETKGSATDAFGFSTGAARKTSQDLTLHEISFGVRYKF